MALSALFRDLLRRKSFWTPSAVLPVSVLVALTELVLAPTWIAWRAYSAEVRLFFPERRPVALPITQAAIEGLREVELPNGGDTLGAWYRAAREPKTLYLVLGGSHGNFIQTAGDEYLERLIGQFSKALAAP